MKKYRIHKVLLVLTLAAAPAVAKPLPTFKAAKDLRDFPPSWQNESPGEAMVLPRQQTQITGIVRDANGPLPSVTITVKGKSITTISGAEGAYRIDAEPGDILIFSCIGYTTREILLTDEAFEPAPQTPKPGTQNLKPILLQPDARSLQEVTVNAGYYTVKQKERTGSIATVKAVDIEKQPVNNPLAAMAGRMSGVSITQATGTPGGGFAIQIRGLNSIRPEGNEPLYLVNGVPYAAQSIGDATTGSAAIPNLTNPLNSLNPADIESIEVLKDADATAIYGSRGANGVVLITTKKGRAGADRFSLNAYTSFGTVTRTPDLMNTQPYLAMRAEAFANDGITEYPANAYDINGTWDPNRYTDWKQKFIGGTAVVNNVQASASGGSERTQYLVSGTYRKETTVFPGDSHYGKGAVNSNITHRSADDRFHIDFATAYAGDKNTLPGVDLTGKAYALAPNAPALYDEEGNLNWEEGTFNNPLAFLEASYKVTSQNLVANSVMDYRIGSGFTIRASLGYNDYRIQQRYTSPLSMYNPFDTSAHEASLYVANGRTRSWIAEPQLTYVRSAGDWKFDALVGTTFQEKVTAQTALTASGFTSDALVNNLAAASSVDVLSDNETVYRYNALFARFNLKYKGRYIFNLTGRRDGSSRFGPGRSFANFGAVGAAWIFSAEPFMETAKSILSFGKLRASYGLTGSDQVGDYQFLDTYAISQWSYAGIVGLTPARLYNPRFGWETNRKLEAALELGFLNDRIFLTAAAYRNRSSDQLVGIPLPGTTGFPSIQSNLAATVQNAGFELDLRTANVRTGDFDWTTTVNFAASRNKLVEFPDLASSTYANTLVVGQSLYINKVLHHTGIDPVTGTYTFEDVDADGTITDADRQAIVDTAPDWFGGIANNFRYKSLTLDFLFQFVRQLGRNQYYSGRLPGSMNNLPAEMTGHFPQDGADALSQVYTSGQNYPALDAWYNYTNSDAAFSDASYIRLKTISLTWDLPAKLSKHLKGSIYLQGQNLLTFTNYKGADPENRSVDYLPPLKQYTLGLRLNF